MQIAAVPDDFTGQWLALSRCLAIWKSSHLVVNGIA